MSRTLTACLVCVSFLVLSADAAAQVVPPNINLSKTAGNQYETAVAINPLDARQIFMVSRNETGGLYSARTSDGGATWTRKLLGSHNPPAPGDVPRAYGNASVAWDALGNLFLVYLSQNTPTTPATYVTLAVSKDSGANFYSPTGSGAALLLPTNTPPYLVGDQPTVTTGPGSAGSAGSVWVTYFSQGGIWVSSAGVSSTGTIGTITSQLLPSQPASVNYGDIAVGPAGQAIVTYGPNTGSSGSLFVNVDPDGLGVAPFGAYVTVTAVNIGGFSYIPAQPNWGIDPEAGLAWDRTSGPHRGRILLMYTDAPSVGSYDTSIYVVHSDDQGATWSARVRVDDDPGARSQFLPRISLDQSSGLIAVTWLDARNSPGNDTAQYFGTFSADGGASFMRNFQISAGTSDQARSIPAQKDADYGDYTGNAFSGGLLVPAWGDNSNSTGDNPEGATNFDVYTALIRASATSAGSVPDGASVPGAPMLVGKAAGGSIQLLWSRSCLLSDPDYAVYEGQLGNFTSHLPRLCSTGGATTATLVPAAGSRYYLVAPHTATAEGSLGRNSAQVERPPSASACLAQALAGCP